MTLLERGKFSMELFEYINKTIYGNLELVLQKLDDRLDLKLYAFVMDEGPNIIRGCRPYIWYSHFPYSSSRFCRVPQRIFVGGQVIF
ncbi:hypothetical protein D3C78_1679150 [compost metagenome]